MDHGVNLRLHQIADTGGSASSQTPRTQNVIRNTKLYQIMFPLGFTKHFCSSGPFGIETIVEAELPEPADLPSDD